MMEVEEEIEDNPGARMQDFLKGTIVQTPHQAVLVPYVVLVPEMDIRSHILQLADSEPGTADIEPDEG